MGKFLKINGLYINNYTLIVIFINFKINIKGILISELYYKYLFKNI